MGLSGRRRGKPTIADFASMLMQGLRKAGVHSEMQFDPEGARIIKGVEREGTVTINLTNLYATYLAKPPKERAKYLRTCVRTALVQEIEPPEDFKAARPNLRVRLYSRARLEFQRLHNQITGGGDGPDAPCVPLGGHLVAIPAYDWPESTQMVSAENLERWGVTIYEALEAGKANLSSSQNRRSSLLG
jgi:hypothetical protein